MRIVRDTQEVSRPALGLRESKKRRTRQALIEAATRLYREKGFDRVTVAEIAHEADVAPRTFFGYFETKEDVFLGRGDDRLDRLVRAIRERDRRLPILVAIRPVLLQNGEPPLPAASARRRPDLPDLLRHPAMAHRLRERWNQWEDVLAQAIAEDVAAAASDPRPRVVAAAITGAIRTAAAAAAEQPSRRKQVAAQVFELLASGLARYGARPGRRSRPASDKTLPARRVLARAQARRTSVRSRV